MKHTILYLTLSRSSGFFTKKSQTLSLKFELLLGQILWFKVRGSTTMPNKKQIKVPRGVEYDLSPKVSFSYCIPLKLGLREARSHEPCHMSVDKSERVHTYVPMQKK